VASLAFRREVGEALIITCRAQIGVVECAVFEGKLEVESWVVRRPRPEKVLRGFWPAIILYRTQISEEGVGNQFGDYQVL
jgi:hypothetical protein